MILNLMQRMMRLEPGVGTVCIHTRTLSIRILIIIDIKRLRIQITKTICTIKIKIAHYINNYLHPSQFQGVPFLDLAGKKRKKSSGSRKRKARNIQTEGLSILDGPYFSGKHSQKLKSELLKITKRRSRKTVKE